MQRQKKADTAAAVSAHHGNQEGDRLAMRRSFRI